jgi:hypothetical protein
MKKRGLLSDAARDLAQARLRKMSERQLKEHAANMSAAYWKSEKGLKRRLAVIARKLEQLTKEEAAVRRQLEALKK